MALRTIYIDIYIYVYMDRYMKDLWSIISKNAPRKNPPCVVMFYCTLLLKGEA